MVFRRGDCCVWYGLGCFNRCWIVLGSERAMLVTLSLISIRLVSVCGVAGFGWGVAFHRMGRDSLGMVCYI